MAEAAEVRTRRGQDRAALVAASLLVVGLRAWAAGPARFPLIVADEPAYLSMARLLGGGHGWDLGRAATYGPGYSLLLAPWSAAGLSPDRLYRVAIGTNVAAAVLGFLLLEALVRRLTTVARPWSILLALTGTLTPALVTNATYAWSDSLAVTAFLALVLACTRLVDRPGLGRALVVGAAATAAFAVHGRFAPAALVAAALVVALGVRRRLRRWDAAGATASLLVGLLAVHVASAAVYDRLYASGDRVDQTTTDLGRALRLWPVLLTASGQLWYLLVTTAGLAGIGLLGLAGAARQGRRARTAGVAPGPAAGVALALVGVTMACSAAFMAGRDRADQLVYGRYNDAVVGLLLAVGLGRLAAVRSPRRRVLDAVAVLGATAATSLLVQATRHDLLAGPYNGITIRALLALGPGGPRDLARYTVVGLGVAAVVAVLAMALHRRPPVLYAVVAVLALFGTWRGVDRTVVERTGDPRAAARLDAIVAPGALVEVVEGAGAYRQGFFRYPYYAPGLHLRVTTEPVWTSGAPWILAPLGHPGVIAAGYRLAWSDPVNDLGLWRAPDR